MKKLFEDLTNLNEASQLNWETDIEAELWNMLGPTKGKFPAYAPTDMSIIKRAFANIGITDATQFELGRAQGILAQVMSELLSESRVNNLTLMEDFGYSKLEPLLGPDMAAELANYIESWIKKDGATVKTIANLTYHYVTSHGNRTSYTYAITPLGRKVVDAVREIAKSYGIS